MLEDMTNQNDAQKRATGLGDVSPKFSGKGQKPDVLDQKLDDLI